MWILRFSSTGPHRQTANRSGLAVCTPLTRPKPQDQTTPNPQANTCFSGLCGLKRLPSPRTFHSPQTLHRSRRNCPLESR